MNERPNEGIDDLVRRALADEASRIEPADALPEIQARVRDQRSASTRRPWLLTTGAAVLGTAAAVGAFTVLNDGTRNAGETGVAGPSETASASSLPSSPVPASPATEPTSAPKPTASDEPSASKAPTTRATTTAPKEKTFAATLVPLYWVGGRHGSTAAGADLRLYRTYTKVAGDPAFEAVRLLSTSRADDPDYDSVWRGATVNSVKRSGGVIRVDFRSLPASRVAPEAAEVAVQQLVYTVQGALKAPRTPVLITEQGRPAARLFGQVDTSKPVARAEQARVQALVWIVDPQEGAVVKTPVTVNGVAAAFEATVNWRVTNLRTRQTQADYTTTEAGQTFSPFTFQLKLAPGQYRLEAYLLSAEDGSETDLDSKTVTVR